LSARFFLGERVEGTPAERHLERSSHRLWQGHLQGAWMVHCEITVKQKQIY